ncbi:CBS domain-containing protein [Sorangium sp. So ce1000]|uniref:CBS domain-containing protein n=1 Tax=Sorangium sp. So ce1000 TaxID=3133325 RepID=UPI003F5E337E
MGFPEPTPAPWSVRWEEAVTTAGELCHRRVVTIGKTETVIEAARRMRAHHVGSLVIVDEPAGSSSGGKRRGGSEGRVCQGRGGHGQRATGGGVHAVSRSR